MQIVDSGRSWVKTPHFEERQRQRQISDFVVALALRFGACFYEGTDLVFFLGRKHLPAGVNEKMARRANGTIVVASADGYLVTTYRNPERLSKLKKRPRH